MSGRITRSKQKSLSIFRVWKEYEQIAMHFNELLIQLRMRALGGVAAITALVSFLSKGDTSADFRWGIVAAVLSVLAIVWAAIWIIDAKYYTRLLLGSVRAVLEVEVISRKAITITGLQMSHRIKETVEGNFSNLDKNPFWKDAVWWFYTLVLIALLVGIYFSLAQHCINAKGTSLAHSLGICHAIPNWYSTPQ